MARFALRLAPFVLYAWLGIAIARSGGTTLQATAHGAVAGLVVSSATVWVRQLVLANVAGSDARAVDLLEDAGLPAELLPTVSAGLFVLDRALEAATAAALAGLAASRTRWRALRGT